VDDKVHDTFAAVVKAIQSGQLREPARLMGFVRTITQRQAVAYIDTAVRLRRDQTDFDSAGRVADSAMTPEQAIIFYERNMLVRRVLAELSDRDREILARFYLREQPKDQICSEMSLTKTQFRLLKSRARARFAELGRRKLNGNSLQRIFLRNTAASGH
jgi:RNA polymerase sigma factor (sigma-70 family)